MAGIDEILNRLPEGISHEIKRLPADALESLEEIRMKAGQPIRVFTKGREYLIQMEIHFELLNNILNHILQYSYYAYEEELSKGYVTIEGGHRVGVCGKTVVENGQVKLIRDISSLNIRRGREVVGVCESCLGQIVKSSSEIYNTIIVSPPKCGKTTLLRDIIRSLSHNGFKVGVCDERSEIAGVYMGRPSFDLGPRTDILDGCPKAQGMIMLIRSMSPDIIATDEIGKKEDVYAIEAALCAGIGIVTTIHGSTYEDILHSGVGESIIRRAFQRIIFLSALPKTGTIREIRNV